MDKVVDMCKTNCNCAHHQPANGPCRLCFVCILINKTNLKKEVASKQRHAQRQRTSRYPCRSWGERNHTFSFIMIKLYSIIKWFDSQKKFTRGHSWLRWVFEMTHLKWACDRCAALTRAWHYPAGGINGARVGGWRVAGDRYTNGLPSHLGWCNVYHDP